MADFEFTFEALTFDEVEAERKRKQVERNTAAIVREWMQAFHNTGYDVGGRYAWNTLPAPIAKAFAPKVSENGNRVNGGMAAVVRTIKKYQDELDVYPVPLDDPFIHQLNGDQDENGNELTVDDPITAADPRYGGFLLVRKSARAARNKQQAASDETPAEKPAKK